MSTSGAPISSPSASNVGSAATIATGTTIPGATFSGTSGSLVFLTSKLGTTASTNTVAFTLTGATCSASSLTTVGTTVTANFQQAIGWCLLSNSATVTPAVAWSVSPGGTFTDLTTTMFTSTSGFNSSPLDQSIQTAVSATAQTSCSSGSTSATTNANDLVVGVGMNFNVGQTYTSGTTGYTPITAGSRNTTSVQYKNVSATGAQSFALTFTSDIWACSVFAFKMN